MKIQNSSGIELPLHDGLPEAEGAVDDDDPGEAAVGIQREHDAGARARSDATIRWTATDRQHGQVIEAVLDAVHDGAVGEDGGEAAPTGVEHGGRSPDTQIALVLAGEAGLGKVLGRRARPDRHREAPGAVLAAQ